VTNGRADTRLGRSKQATADRFLLLAVRRDRD
jgi:hypothetical protein